MKKIEIRGFAHAEVDAGKETFGFLKLPVEHTLIRAEGEDLEVSDGYHTMDELYDHRIELFVALCRNRHDLYALEKPEKYKLWRSKNHSDGEPAFGGEWFVLGIGTAKGYQITYHLPIDRWADTEFVETLDKAPEWDGHTSADVLGRLKLLG